MTIQEAIREHIPDKKIRLRIGMSLEKRNVDLISVQEFNEKYNYDAIMQFPNIGKETADILTEVINKSL